MSIILASQSPRRRELLERMGFHNFTVLPARGEETAPAGLSPAGLVEALSAQKAEEVAARTAPGDLIIAADTVVAIDGLVLGKPAQADQAAAMLRRLSGREHAVFTGVTLRRGADTLTAHEETRVRFVPLTEAEIAAYVATGEPMDKAGAYGIQGYGAMLVAGIQGDYFNVMGLPVCRLRAMLARFGIDPLTGGEGTA
jgi:septum formation protein